MSNDEQNFTPGEQEFIVKAKRWAVIHYGEEACVRYSRPAKDSMLLHVFPGDPDKNLLPAATIEMGPFGVQILGSKSHDGRIF